ncbi:MAG: hypothetical protein PHT33_15860, partial [bacterium]|nr:hypothetical protein [bacterium]
GLIYAAGLPIEPESLLRLREVDAPVLSLLREVFWGLSAIIAFHTVIPIALGGLLLGLIVPQMLSIRSRYTALASLVLLEGIACWLVFVVQGTNWKDACELVLLPVSFQSPYINTSSVLFFWLPVFVQGSVGLRISWLRPLITSLAGVLTIIAGFVFLMAGNILVGAPVD